MFDSIMIRRGEETAIDIVNAVLGVCLALAPWALGFTGEVAAAWNAWIVGAAIALVAVGALVAFTQWEVETGRLLTLHSSKSGVDRTCRKCRENDARDRYCRKRNLQESRSNIDSRSEANAQS
jgi:hypothetical protein